MSKYEEGDLVTYWFIVKDDKKNDIKHIKGWTSKKVYAEYYIEFHNCPNFSIKKVTKPIEEIYKLAEENFDDEIKLGSVIIKRRTKKNSKYEQDFERITIPVTKTEMNLIGTEYHSFFSGHVDYGYLNQVLPYLKKKYRDAAEKLFLQSIIMKTVHNKFDKDIEYIQLDQLIILVKSLPDEFGE